ncbi:MAG: hypothetical protein AAGC76_10360 [Luteibacter sp.]|uniref:hypothetical protein n=1 Tax=unclassified Luteibacter TaxID=2620188 RepID=UPI0005BDEDFC|nr:MULTISPECIES: hypothetical protein [unclassified Luteibacter]MDQ7996243.1 hypothetical protein [Luteibacter sp.]MDQ8049506.1 hypothetical protein [Luteibacter sp.]
MSDFDPPTREYTRPQMTRGVDPQRMNWLWQLILQSTDLDPADVRKALNAMGVAATEKRMNSWQVGDRDEDYFPLTIAELERNLRAVVAWKKVRSDAASASAAEAAPAGGASVASSDAASAASDDSGDQA